MRLIYVSNLDVYFEWTLVPCESSGHCLPQLPWPDQAKKAISSPSTRLELSVKRHPYFHDRQTLQGNLSTAGFQNASKKSTQANLLRRRPFKDRSIPSFGTKIEGQIACVYIYIIYIWMLELDFSPDYSDGWEIIKMLPSFFGFIINKLHLLYSSQGAVSQFKSFCQLSWKSVSLSLSIQTYSWCTPAYHRS